MHQVVNQVVYRLHRAAPESTDIAKLHALADFAVFTHGLAQAPQFGGHALVHFHHFIEGIGHLAGKARPLFGQPHAGLTVFEGLKRRKQHQHFGFAGLNRHFCRCRLFRHMMPLCVDCWPDWPYDAFCIRRFYWYFMILLFAQFMAKAAILF